MTVLDVQPRMVSSGGGKTSDEIVYELAENILGKLPDNLDMDKANKALFEVKKCTLNILIEAPCHFSNVIAKGNWSFVRNILL